LRALLDFVLARALLPQHVMIKRRHVASVVVFVWGAGCHALQSDEDGQVAQNATSAPAITARLAWDANREPDLAGYKIYRGLAAGAYAAPTDVGNVITYNDTGVADLTNYWYAVTAYDTSGNESTKSTEATFYNRPPAVSFSANPTQGPSPLVSHLSCSATDPDAQSSVYYDLDFGDGSPHVQQATPISVDHTYTTSGNAVCKVTDNRGSTTPGTIPINVNPTLTPQPPGYPSPGVTLTPQASGPFAVQFVCAESGIDGSLNYRGKIDYGDGTFEMIFGPPSPVTRTHTYAAAGYYTVQCNLRRVALGTNAVRIRVGSDGSLFW
jgi:PKD repeat protein